MSSVSWKQWSCQMKNTRFTKWRFVVVGSRALAIARLGDLSLILLKVKCPVVAVEEGSRSTRPLPARARPPIMSSKSLPAVLEADTEDSILPERLTRRIALMNVRPRIEEVAETSHCLCLTMRNISVRSSIKFLSGVWMGGWGNWSITST